MIKRWRPITSERPFHGLRRCVALGAGIGVISLAAATPLQSEASQSLGQLNSSLGAEQAHQQHLSDAVGHLSGLISSLSGQIALVEQREAEVRAALATDRAKLHAAGLALDRQRARLAAIRTRLAHARSILSAQLVSSYENQQPNLVNVVLDSHGFTDLLERINFLHRAQSQQQALVKVTQLAKAQAEAAAKVLQALEAKDRRLAEAQAVRARALAGMNGLLQSKQAALQKARAAQQAALDASRARSAHLRAQISHIEAQRAAAARAAAAAAAAAASPSSSSSSSSTTALGPSGGWAIPYPIVLCESGGQNLPPNSAGASGYYQIMPATWSLFGGSGPAAYLASKAEQDAVASRIWNGGAGASNWVCAGIVGIT
jgi:peptidoglycan hydrolase CwlO-like protein